MIDSLETQYLKLLLKSQQEWDQKYSKNILAFPGPKRIAHYLNHLAKYSNHKDFKTFMRNRTYHKVKADFLIILLCLLNCTDGEMIDVRTDDKAPYNKHLEKIFWLKDEWDHTGDDEYCLGLFNHIKALYNKYMTDFGLSSIQWVDQRRLDWYDKLEKPKRSKKHDKED